MELGKEDTIVPPRFNCLFEQGFLISEVVLLAEELSHTAIVIFERANQGTLHMHAVNAEPSLLEGLLQALGFTSLSCHFLRLPMVLNIWVVYGYCCVFLLSLLSPI
jgi:hypothetical protein